MRCVLFTAALVLVFLVGEASAAGSEKVVFASWNLRHYRTKGTVVGGKKIPAKSDASIEAVSAVLAEVRPDILGVSEMGSVEDLKSLQRSLAKVGVKLPYRTYVAGNDAVRHIALLSRYPLREVRHDSESSFESGGEKYRVRRGFLDCVVDVGAEFSLHIFGAHLKSRRIEAGLDQEEVRRFEAKLLRLRVESVLEGEPDVPLLVFGDFNDTKNSPAVRGMLGRKGAKDSLSLVPLADEVGDQWTYWWQETDEYSRIDFLMVNTPLRKLIDAGHSYVHRSSKWREASDHRPLVLTIQIPSFKKSR